MSSVGLLRLGIGLACLVSIYQALLFYLPYYLIRTRGRIGWLWLLGLVVLNYLGVLLQWVVYAAS